jgi:flagellar motility protein MotE (MotC chaperone)
MMAKILSPVLCSALGLLLSVAIGISTMWRTLNVVVERAVFARAHKQPSELKKKGWDFWTIEVENLSSELKEDRERLKKESDQLDQREARIAAEERELAKARSDIEQLQKQISDRVVEISADEMVNLRKLSQTYANLTPRAVVAIIREMDDNTAVKILSLMKPDVVGPIFEEMSKNAGTDGAPLSRRAAILSDKLRLVKSNKPAAPAP